MRKEPSHWYLGDVRGITSTVIYGILPSLPVRLAKRLKFCQFWASTTVTAEMRVPYLLSHSHLSEDQWSFFALIRHQALSFSRIVMKALFAEQWSILPSAGCKQRPRNSQKTRTGRSLKTPISRSYWLPSVTREVADPGEEPAARPPPPPIIIPNRGLTAPPPPPPTPLY